MAAPIPQAARVSVRSPVLILSSTLISVNGRVFPQDQFFSEIAEWPASISDDDSWCLVSRYVRNSTHRFAWLVPFRPVILSDEQAAWSEVGIMGGLVGRRENTLLYTVWLRRYAFQVAVCLLVPLGLVWDPVDVGVANFLVPAGENIMSAAYLGTLAPEYGVFL
ncbi:hypothetical protein BDY19DRAFT_998489 [Irpex rosettiformis]|uniref:Uncharacterized protein n=1 Tax=Irpex rosettiformis TaxID=378272 RepID=A0ACB8TNK4_9APHY|nr:hypothetical protein BDY19DRAFT_998489 [Irpex rosettiformis]